jgi:ribosome-associated translation inhibitor RaiA
MEIRVSAPGHHLEQHEIDAIQKDLEKIDRRLNRYDEVFAEVRINGNQSIPAFHVVLEVEYRRNHLRAKADNPDIGMAVREAREEILRQINDRAGPSHSSYAKGR